MRKILVHEDYGRSHTAKGSSERSFGFVFAVVFLIVALWPLVNDFTAWPLIRWWAVAVAAAISAIAVVRPTLLRPANQVWLRFGLLLHRITNPIIMAVLFFGVVTPFGVIMRMFGKDPMRRRFDTNASSYWIPRESGNDATILNMKNQF